MDMAKSIDRAELASPVVARCQWFKNDFIAADNGQLAAMTIAGRALSLSLMLPDTRVAYSYPALGPPLPLFL